MPQKQSLPKPRSFKGETIKERYRSVVSKPAPAYPEYTSTEAYCNSHPDEEVTYFCFDCLVPPVCSECVIHGIHKDHEVMHIKKGYPAVKDKLEEVIQGLTASVENLQGDKKVLQNKKELVVDQSEAAKAQLKTLIDDLITRIEKKEKELMRQIVLATEDSLKELESYERVIDDKLATLSNNIKYIQENMANGPLSTLTFYADNNKLLVQVADQEMQNSEKYEARLMATSMITPDTILREVKGAANNAAEAIGRIRFGTKKSKVNDRNELKSFSKNSIEVDDYT